jgi:hypothetical protein
MTAYGLLAAAAALPLLAATVRVHRFTRTHLTVRVTLAGRGLYVSRTPDGVWWAIRVRRRACPPTAGRLDDGGPEQGGVREPRRPVGPGPLAAADAITPPDD